MGTLVSAVSRCVLGEEIRFPKQNSPPGPVITYRLSPEELAEVCRRCPPVDPKERARWLLLKRLAASLPEEERRRFLWGVVGARDV